MVKNYSIVLICLTGLVSAQYSAEWSVNQDGYEYGMVSLDINDDGIKEITKHLWNSISIFDGAQNYSLVWYLENLDYEYLSLYDMYDMQGNNTNIVIVLSYNLTSNTNTIVSAYNPYSETPIWESDIITGTIYRLDAADLDNDGTLEIAFGYNNYDSTASTYTSGITILDGMTGIEEWSNNLNGYLIGPYLGNQDTDEIIEIVYNLYDLNTGEYTLNIIGYSGTTSVFRPDHLPEMIKLGVNYPNPFNGRTVIPVTLETRTQLNVDIVDLKGNIVKTIANGVYAPGRYQYPWNGQDNNGIPVSSGQYFYKLIALDKTLTRPVLLLK